MLRETGSGSAYKNCSFVNLNWKQLLFIKGNIKAFWWKRVGIAYVGRSIRYGSVTLGAWKHGAWGVNPILNFRYVTVCTTVECVWSWYAQYRKVVGNISNPQQGKKFIRNSSVVLNSIIKHQTASPSFLRITNKKTKI